MAHIPDGLLSAPVLIGGAVLTVGGLALDLQRLDESEIPKTAILASTFFVASLVAVPVGPSSVHLLLSGLMGLVLGLRAIPAVFVGLLLQAVLFGFGGLTSLGVDLVNIAFPGVAAALLARLLLAKAHGLGAAAIGAGVAAFTAFTVVGTAACVSAALALSSADYLPSLRVIALTYIPLALVEAVITGFVIAYLKRVKPESLGLTAQPEGAA
ncbi:cobalt transporter CbiM [Rhodoblastus acidophilus]|uniref:Cobalt transporter CbiM n=1 Tax=Rhodoblastus acidophilus TaxID=1074 RepID=A0A6N8DHG6_RHOAC|nr:cobalt transporter CbiM [Rhodoblastus acidophilus]MCW2272935.1 cobalt/nickel transport system permease protein [Rhodoblastus acidophilus]MTV29842.1 cobalt transporter CbiM [Rhodoblastus acidophilus]